MGAAAPPGRHNRGRSSESRCGEPFFAEKRGGEVLLVHDAEFSLQGGQGLGDDEGQEEIDHTGAEEELDVVVVPCAHDLG